MEQKPEKAQPPEPSIDLVEGTLERFTFRNEDTGFAVVRFAPADGSEPIRVVGQLAQLAEGQKLRITGQSVEHPRFGPQVQAQSVEAIMPTSVEGIRSYLASSLVKGVGPATAEKITDRFGADTLRVIEEEPDRLREVSGLGATRIADLVKAVQSQKDVQEVMVFLRAHGLGQALAVRIVKRYGKGAAALIQANPFRLADEVIGVGFKTADRLAAELGISHDAPERIRAGSIFCLGRATREGHCFLRASELIAAATELLSVPPEAVAEELPELARQGRLRIEVAPGQTEASAEQPELVYPVALHMAEAGIARLIDRLQRHNRQRLGIDPERALDWYENRSGMQLPAGQHAAVVNGLCHPVSVITGGPGVGKTTIIRALSEILLNHDRRLLLCAPTGRAAKRLEESTKQPASTIHRLLDWQVGRNDFTRNQENPLEGDMVVVDEASMLDVQLAYNLFRAIPPTMKLVLVGDINQLPSVGPGQVLRDIIESEVVPLTTLSEIFRQHRESLIIQNAHDLLMGETPRTSGDDGDFFVIEARSNQHIRELIQSLVTKRIPQRFAMDPLEDIQVLCPMYRGHAGADTINKDLQDLLNPGDRQIERSGKCFREGDKVMQIRNDYDLELFNGDTGRITALDPSGSAMLVRFGSRTLEYPFSELDSLVPAYAITVHRSQGSEYPAVVMPLATDHYMMLRRNLLYTAMTRGRRLVVLVGSKKALGMAVRNNEESNRNSALSARLRGLSD